MNIFAQAIFLLAVRALGFIFPYVGVYVNALGAERNKIFYFLSLLYLSSSFAFLVVLREPTSGVDAGYGADAQYYMDAFDVLSRMTGFDIQEIVETGLLNTGSAEPFFWIFSYLLSIIFKNSLAVWWAIGALTLFLIGFSAYKLDKRIGFYVLALFVSTITYYVFPGSGLRQGLAFAVLFFSAIELFRNKRMPCTLLAAIAVLTHSSSLPVAVILISGVWESKSYGVRVIKVLLVLIAVIAFYYLQSVQIESKFAAYSEVSRQDLAYVQALVESVFLAGLLFVYRRLFPSNFKNSFCFFLISLVAVALFFQGGGFERYYRYLYVFGLLILARVSTANLWFLRASLSSAFAWLLFVVYSRYADLFVDGGLLGHVFYSPLYLLFQHIES